MPYSDPIVAKQKRREWYHRDKKYFLDEQKKFLANPINLEKRKANIRQRMKLPHNRQKNAQWKKEQNDKRLQEWEKIIPAVTNCQVCQKLISFRKRPDMGVIHFDHRWGGKETIKNTPRKWLKANKPTPENLKIWESCDFGLLCLKCNSVLPTENRSDFIDGLIAYHLGKT